jgi:AraC-like DNA-binding protein
MHRIYAPDGYAELTRRYIERTLVKRAPTVIDAAKSFGISVRTLQRRLTDENTAFSVLLDDCRRVRAFDSCNETGSPRPKMHEELGYAQRSCLARAMRRWKYRSVMTHQGSRRNERRV